MEVQGGLTGSVVEGSPETIRCDATALLSRLQSTERRYLVPQDFNWDDIAQTIANIRKRLPEQQPGLLRLSYSTTQFDNEEWRCLTAVTHLLKAGDKTGMNMYTSRYTAEQTFSAQLDWRPNFINGLKGMSDFDQQLAEWNQLSAEQQAALQQYDQSLETWWENRTYEHWYEVFDDGDEDVRQGMWDELDVQTQRWVRQRYPDVDSWADTYERSQWNRQRITRPTDHLPPVVTPEMMQAAADNDMAVTGVDGSDDDHD
jgi:hypothetical protein